MYNHILYRKDGKYINLVPFYFEDKEYEMVSVLNSTKNKSEYYVRDKDLNKRYTTIYFTFFEKYILVFGEENILSFYTIEDFYEFFDDIIYSTIDQEKINDLSKFNLEIFNEIKRKIEDNNVNMKYLFNYILEQRQLMKIKGE